MKSMVNKKQSLLNKAFSKILIRLTEIQLYPTKKDAGVRIQLYPATMGLATIGFLYPSMLNIKN